MSMKELKYHEMKKAINRSISLQFALKNWLQKNLQNRLLMLIFMS